MSLGERWEVTLRREPGNELTGGVVPPLRRERRKQTGAETVLRTAELCVVEEALVALVFLQIGGRFGGGGVAGGGPQA